VRGFLILVAAIAFAIIGCYAIPFVLMPGAGIGVALPVIYVPGEHIESLGHLPGNVPVTNTIIASWVTMLVCGLWILPVIANRKEVPGRAQAFIEMIAEYWMNFAKTVAGDKGRQLIPLTLSIFFFLLVANVMKIFPGVDTIGELHCAGLVNEAAVGEVEEFQTIEYFEELEESDPAIVEGYLEDFGAASIYELSEDDLHELGEKEHTRAEKDNFTAFSGYKVQNISGDFVVALENTETLYTGINMDFEQYKDCKVSLHEGDIYNEAPEDTTDDSDTTDGVPSDGAEEGDDDADADSEGEEGDDAEGESSLMLVSNTSGDNGATTAPAADEEERKYNTNPGNDYYSVTPFIRGATTDLSLTLAISIIAMFMVQFFAIKELGVGGWGVKFINLPAIEAGGIKIIDFAVGLLEIVLEFAKVVSFAFRLFGAMFAGQILMFVIVFLVGTFVPVIVVLLEVFIGAIQAFVFSILFIMFATVAMTPHHGDDHDHH